MSDDVPAVVGSVPQRSIDERMVAVFAKVGAVAKSLRNADAGYAARSIDDVMDALHAPMAEEGVYVTPWVESADFQTEEVGRHRTLMRHATLFVRFRFRSVEGESVVARTVGEALDSGDKAANKAMQAAFKYALLDTFVVPLNGDQGDADSATHELSTAAEFATEQQRKALRDAVRALPAEVRPRANAALIETYGPANELLARHAPDALALVQSFAAAAPDADASDGSEAPAGTTGDAPETPPVNPLGTSGEGAEPRPDPPGDDPVLGEAARAEIAAARERLKIAAARERLESSRKPTT